MDLSLGEGWESSDLEGRGRCMQVLQHPRRTSFLSARCVSCFTRNLPTDATNPGRVSGLNIHDIWLLDSTAVEAVEAVESKDQTMTCIS
jgi:hypothetical protein